VIIDSSDDSGASITPPRRKKKAAVAAKREITRRSRRSSNFVPDDEEESDNVTNSSRPRRLTRATSGLEKGASHWDFFTKPKDWHVKNPNPTILAIEDVPRIDIRNLQYPVEIVSSP
jgi:hypothetical protein